MITLGIDLASQADHTAACALEWASNQAVVRHLKLGCTDADLDGFIAEAHAVGIDAPLGWPLAFTEAVAEWTHSEWTKELRDRMRFRLTDYKVREIHGKWPLSVSSDLIALPAMRAMALLQRHHVTDRSGSSEPFFEVYPAASLKAWGFPSQGYKGSNREAPQNRARILESMLQAMPWLQGAEASVEDDNLLDSLVAAISAYQAHQHQTLRPNVKELLTATQEGWIHLPVGLPTLQR